ncbi:MAG: hypothetical protein ACP5UA_14230 [Candidatus Hydrogenedens sp.]
MFPFIKISTYFAEFYNIFNFLAVFVIVLLGVRWNYRYGKKYPLRLGMLLLSAPFAFLIDRIFFFLFLARPSSKMQFFNLERGGSMFLGAFTGAVFGAFIYNVWVHYVYFPILS